MLVVGALGRCAIPWPADRRPFAAVFPAKRKERGTVLRAYGARAGEILRGPGSACDSGRRLGQGGGGQRFRSGFTGFLIRRAQLFGSRGVRGPIQGGVALPGRPRANPFACPQNSPELGRVFTIFQWLSGHPMLPATSVGCPCIRQEVCLLFLDSLTRSWGPWEDSRACAHVLALHDRPSARFLSRCLIREKTGPSSGVGRCRRTVGRVPSRFWRLQPRLAAPPCAARNPSAISCQPSD